MQIDKSIKNTDYKIKAGNISSATPGKWKNKAVTSYLMNNVADFKNMSINQIKKDDNKWMLLNKMTLSILIQVNDFYKGNPPKDITPDNVFSKMATTSFNPDISKETADKLTKGFSKRQLLSVLPTPYKSGRTLGATVPAVRDDIELNISKKPLKAFLLNPLVNDLEFKLDDILKQQQTAKNQALLSDYFGDVILAMNYSEISISEGKSLLKNLKDSGFDFSNITGEYRECYKDSDKDGKIGYEEVVKAEISGRDVLDLIRNRLPEKKLEAQIIDIINQI